MKKKLISGLVATLGVFSPFLAFAQSDLIAPVDEAYDYNYEYDDTYYNDTYDYNYDNYDYDYDSDLGAAGAAFGVGLLIMIIVGGLITLAAWGFTIWMIVDAAKRDFDQKAMWIILMVLFNWLAALIYLFMVKRKNVTRAHPQGSATTPPAAK